MKNQHKGKGYRLESKMQKSTFLEFKRQLSDNLKILQIHTDDWLGTYIVKPNPQIEKYLIQSQIKDLSYISSLNKIDRFLKGSHPKKEDEKQKKHHSQSTEIADKIA